MLWTSSGMLLQDMTPEEITEQSWYYLEQKEKKVSKGCYSIFRTEDNMSTQTNTHCNKCYFERNKTVLIFVKTSLIDCMQLAVIKTKHRYLIKILITPYKETTKWAHFVSRIIFSFLILHYYTKYANFWLSIWSTCDNTYQYGTTNPHVCSSVTAEDSSPTTELFFFFSLLTSLSLCLTKDIKVSICNLRRYKASIQVSERRSVD